LGEDVGETRARQVEKIFWKKDAKEEKRGRKVTRNFFGNFLEVEQDTSNINILEKFTPFEY
jgi:hypothetical protein